ncbi:14201_t:CDS:2, partial [Entrophospora sp. SA101]
MNAADAKKGKAGLALRVFSPCHTTDIPSTIASAGGIMGAILVWLFGSSSLDSWGIARRIAVIRNGIWVIILMILDFVADGVFFAELNEFFTRELAEEGYSGVEVRVTPARTEIIIRATHTQDVLGEKGRRIRELTALIQKRFKFPENTVELYAEKVQNRGLCAIAQCESLRYKLLAGLAVRRACYGVLRFIMESGAKGCEVVVSGKLRAARAKSMKFVDGFMIHSGQPIRDYVDTAVRHVMLRQGVLGIKVKIMK